MKTALLIPDVHWPWGDCAAYEKMLNISRFQNEINPLDEIIILGDFADCYTLSLHKKLPSHLTMSSTRLTDELSDVYFRLHELRSSFPKAKITYLEGNHEFRLGRYIIDKCPEVFGLIKLLPEVLKLDQLKIDWIPYGRHQLYNVFNTDLYCRHAPWNGGKHTAMGTADRGKISLIFGHTHRKQSATIRTADGKEISCISMGNLVNDKSEIFDYMDHDDWSKGFGFVFADKDNWHLTYVDIKGEKAAYHGQIF